MLRNLLCIYILSLSIPAATLAQVAEGGSKVPVESRLTVGTKKKAAPRGPNQQAFRLEYKPITVQKTLALRNYYKSLFYADDHTEEAAAAEVPAVPGVVLTERRVMTAEEKPTQPAEKLFSNERITVSNIYPNPASEKAWIDYSVSPMVRDAKISIYNILGSAVAEFSLDKNDTKLGISTRDMASGVYFYQLVVDGKKVATKKLLVRHQQ